MTGQFPAELAEQARDVLARGVLERRTPHAEQAALARAGDRLGEYWRRSAGSLESARPDLVLAAVRRQLEQVTSWEGFLKASLTLDIEVIPEAERRALDALPNSVHVLGDRVPLQYVIDDAGGAVQVRLREGQARRVRQQDLPKVDRPLRFVVVRGKREVARARTLEGLHQAVAALPRDVKRRRR